jgi:N-acetyl-gamma-glutamyl-phosphate reductase
LKPLVFIDGDQGTTGLEIMNRLSGRSDLELICLPVEHRKDLARRAEAINHCDIAVLCLPDEAARQAVQSVVNPAVRIIDASSAHRTHLDWTYGFAEISALQADRIRRAHRVSNPGCYPTGAIALLRPLIAAGMLALNDPLSIHAVSGYSGGGRSGIEAYEGAGQPRAAGTEAGGERGPVNSSMHSPHFQVYGLDLHHKHVPEIQRHAGLSRRPFFVPAYGAFRQGIVLTIPIFLDRLQGISSSSLRETLRHHYLHSPLIQVLTQDETFAQTLLNPELLNGSNAMQLGVHGNDSQGQVLLSAVFDNLGKGASGAAVQNLDLMLAGS